MKISFEMFILIQEMSQEEREDFKNSALRLERACCIEKGEAEQKVLETLIKLRKAAIDKGHKTDA